jgi:hypothetical protein
MARQCRLLKKFRRPLTTAHLRQFNREPSPDRLGFSGRPHNYLPELSGRRARDPRSRDLGRLCRCTTSRWRDR